MNAESVSRQKTVFLSAMPKLVGFSDSFASINKRWGAAITAGMIESGRMDQEAATLFNPLIQDMGSTRDKFRVIQDRLITAILHEMVKKAVINLADCAKFAINILKRNLFERTADVGYLATDENVVSFLELDFDAAGMGEARDAIVHRLRQYQREYTVYDEIILLDNEGRVRARLNQDAALLASRDPLIAQTIAIDPSGQGDKYLETFRPSDLRPDKTNALIYSQAVLDPKSRCTLGVLCLCFDFEDEMQRIFTDLAQGDGDIVALVLDRGGQVIATSNESLALLGTTLRLSLSEDFSLLTLGGRQYLASTQATDGYQGFYGLEWYGMALVDLHKAFADDAQSAQDAAPGNTLDHVSTELEAIHRESEDILADMTLDSFNGQVKAAKYKADGFVEVLRFVNSIGQEIGTLFEGAISWLQATIISSLAQGVQFRSFQANNISDRNLYERANDVCWWALTPRFRQTLAGLGPAGLDEGAAQSLRDNLQFINELYTPYLRLVLADTQGRVLAVSDPPAVLEEHLVDPDALQGQGFIGTQLEPELVRRTLALAESKDYAVSLFKPTPLYGGRPTYVYATAVRAPEDSQRAVGLLQIVFDAGPQFAAMLADVLPRDENKAPLAGSLAMFVDRSGQVIASTGMDYSPGRVVEVPETFTCLGCGERAASLATLDGKTYLTGCQVSSGYREYKVSDGYENDVCCLVYVPL